MTLTDNDGSRSVPAADDRFTAGRAFLGHSGPKFVGRARRRSETICSPEQRAARVRQQLVPQASTVETGIAPALEPEHRFDLVERHGGVAIGLPEDLVAFRSEDRRCSRRCTAFRHARSGGAIRRHRRAYSAALPGAAAQLKIPRGPGLSGGRIGIVRKMGSDEKNGERQKAIHDQSADQTQEMSCLAQKSLERRPHPAIVVSIDTLRYTYGDRRWVSDD